MVYLISSPWFFGQVSSLREIKYFWVFPDLSFVRVFIILSKSPSLAGRVHRTIKSVDLSELHCSNVPSANRHSFSSYSVKTCALGTGWEEVKETSRNIFSLLREATWSEQNHRTQELYTHTGVLGTSLQRTLPQGHWYHIQWGLRELTGCVHDIPGPLKKPFSFHLSDRQSGSRVDIASHGLKSGSAWGLNVTGASVERSGNLKEELGELSPSGRRKLLGNWTFCG